MHDDAAVGLVDEVGGPADVVQRRRLAVPGLQLPGVRHQPDVHVVALRKPLDLRASGTDGRRGEERRSQVRAVGGA